MMEQETAPKLSSVLLNGIVFENPVFVQLLGMCPTLATSSSVKNALGMGLSATAVLICSNLAISALRKLIPDKVRIAAYIIVIAGFVTAVDLLLQAFFPELSKSLGEMCIRDRSAVRSRLSPPSNHGKSRKPMKPQGFIGFSVVCNTPQNKIFSAFLCA